MDVETTRWIEHHCDGYISELQAMGYKRAAAIGFIMGAGASVHPMDANPVKAVERMMDVTRRVAAKKARRDLGR